jgi:hypothetical protein
MIMTDTPPDWVLIEAAKRGAFRQATIEKMRMWHKADKIFRALCYMIQKYEQQPVDRKLLCAREAVKEWEDGELLPVTDVSIRAIELWEEGFGK